MAATVRSEALRAEEIDLATDLGDTIRAYVAEPTDAAGGRGGVVVIHHMPGYDWATKEIVRRFAAHGYLAACPNLYSREQERTGSPDAARAAAHASGGVPDERLLVDAAASVEWLRRHPLSNGRVGAIGFCSGGRQAFLAGCSMDLDAIVDCYGGFVVNPPPAELGVTWEPIIDRSPSLSCPILGIFGSEDPRPSRAECDELERTLRAHGKSAQFEHFDAGHAFLAVDRPHYRPEAAGLAWKVIWLFLAEHLE